MLDAIAPADLPTWARQCAAAGLGTPVVLDVREPWEVQLASVRADGFTLLTIPMGSVAQRVSEIPREQPVACLCHHGRRSAQVALFLLGQGFAAVLNISGGIHAWSQELDPSVPQY